MSLSKLQRVVIRNSLKIARKLRVNNDTIYVQIPPTKHDFQVHISSPSTVADREILESVYPVELHELIGPYPSRFLDGNMLRSFICSASRLERFKTSIPAQITANEDLALDAYRRLSIQRKLMKTTSSSMTESIRVVATAIFDEEYTELSDDRYLYFYRIFVENTGVERVQLIGRQWSIASGIDLKDIQSVPAFAPGVIGLQPIIEPGGIFHYTSCAVIKTKEGGMDGTFLMMNLTTNEKFVAPLEANYRQPVFAIQDATTPVLAAILNCIPHF